MCFEREGSMGMGAGVKLRSEAVCQNTCSNWKGPVKACGQVKCWVRYWRHALIYRF